MAEEKHIRCWHFLQDDKRLRWGTKEVVKVGKTYTAEGPLVMCENGMHGSRRLIDALQYAPGAVLCKVVIWGEVEEQDDKLVGRHRKVLAMVDATKMLHEAACHFAEEALTFSKCTDERSWNAIKVKRAWLKGKATDKELAAARAAARDAAWAAAWDVVVWVVARDAAWDAAWDAAKNAARDAARDAQNKYLTTQANKLFAKKVKK